MLKSWLALSVKGIVLLKKGFIIIREQPVHKPVQTCEWFFVRSRSYVNYTVESEKKAREQAN